MHTALLSVNSSVDTCSLSTTDEVEPRIEWIDHDHPDRAGMEAFIASEFFRVYGAEIDHFCQVLAGCRDRNGQWIAALGFSLAKDGKLFLEQYLDKPIETAISQEYGGAIKRADIVEVGNLAAKNAGAARKLIVFMTRYLYGHGRTWVAFTATRGLLNSFARLRLAPTVLAEADPGRLPDQGRHWGSYYASKPQVMCGNIRSGYAQLVK